MPPLWPRERERALLGESGSQVPGGLGHADLRDRLVPALMLQRSASSAAHAAGGGTSWRRSLHWPLPRLQNSKCPNPLFPLPPPPPGTVRRTVILRWRFFFERDERVCVDYCRTEYKAVYMGGGGDMGGHVLRETTSRGLCNVAGGIFFSA
jgi:hypothetical protein